MRRDLMVAAAVVVCVTGLGSLIAFATGDAARLFRSVQFLFDDRPQVVAAPPSKTAQTSKITGCKYCLTLKALHAGFAEKARAATMREKTAQLAIESAGQTSAADRKALAERKADLAAAREAWSRNSTAKESLQPYLAACEQEAFCRPDFLKKAAQSCPEAIEDAGLRAPAIGMAAVAREAALACVATQCPQVDCVQAAALRQDLIDAAAALSRLGAPLSPVKGQPLLKDLPVGAATLAEEVKKAVTEIEYTASRYPELIEQGRMPEAGAPASRAQVSELAAQQAEALRNAADVMTQAAVVTPFAYDARREAAWRLKALSLSVASAGQMSLPDQLNGPQGQAYRLALSQNWGAALVDLAAVMALLDKVNAQSASATGCNGQTEIAAQAARDAAALVDICRARASCPVAAGRGAGPGDSLDAAREALGELIPRAQSIASVLAANAPALPQTTQQPPELAQAALVLNAGGACRAGGQ